MRWQKEIWTYLIVTLVTVLIWAWAAGETRERKTINYARVQFTVPEQENWIIEPQQQPAILVVEGSKLSLQKAESLLRRSPLRISVSPTAGRQSIDLADRLRSQDELRETGVTVLSAEPPAMDVTLDRIERVAASVKPVLPGVTAEGEITIEPKEVIIGMPNRVRQRLPQGVSVEAFVDRFELDQLEPGIRHTRDVKVRLPPDLAANQDVTVTPGSVTMSFTIRSRTRETKLENVRVQLAGPPEDRELYALEIEPKQLRGITISADSDLVRRIEANEVPVIAFLHVSSREKEARIDSKRISYFMALVPEPGGATRYVPVNFKGTAAELPVISLKITPRGT